VRLMKLILGMLASLMLALVIAPTSARAQQDQNQTQQSAQAQGQNQSQSQGNAPIPAYHSPLAGLSDNGDAASADQMQPDTRPLAGAQDIAIGTLPNTHSYWEPHFDITTTGDSNPLNASGSNGWTTWTTLMAGIDLHRVSGNSNLAVTYTAGGEISNDGNSNSSILQQFGLNEKISWRRSTLTLIDQLDYVPDIAIGYGSLSGLQLPGGGSLGLQQGFLPGQAIVTPEGERLTNTAIVQDDTYLTPRSSITFVAGYSLLHYYGSDLLNMGDTIFQGGYNYQMTRKDTLAVFYRFSGYRYGNINQSINDNLAQLSYGRRVTGKLAFQIAAGPEISFLQIPISTTSGSGTGGGSSGGTGTVTLNSQRQIYWSLNSSLTYQLQRTGFVASYNHGLSGGSGVFAGAVSDSVSGAVSRQLSRVLGGGMNFGYSRNAGVDYAAATPINQSYDYWFGGANLSRPFGRDLNVSLAYQIQYQNSNVPFCIGTACETTLTRNMITLSVAWHSRPLTY
jgi:hypothetical protein